MIDSIILLLACIMSLCFITYVLMALFVVFNVVDIDKNKTSVIVLITSIVVWILSTLLIGVLRCIC